MNIYICVCVMQTWNVLALDGSNWQRVDLFEFQKDVEVSQTASLVSSVNESAQSSPANEY